MSSESKSPVRSRVTASQIGGILAIVAVCFLFVYFEALVIGYVFVTLLLCAFFVVVAFDIGVPKRPRSEEAD